MLFMSREGIEPSTSAFGEPRSGPVELPQRIVLQWSKQDSNLHLPGSGPGASAGWATGPLIQPARIRMHRAGLEPATLRLKASGSTFELSVPNAPGGTRTLSRLFRRELLWFH